MLQYIHSKNQTLLWNTIQKHPYIMTVFPPGNEERKTRWFKDIISNIYDSIRSKDRNQINLTELNKETLKQMIENMRQQITIENSRANSKPFHSEIPQNNEYNISEPNRLYSRESILQNKTTIFERDLVQRQNEYENLHQKPTPPTVKFEEINDGVIKNMDELIEQQRRERELDLQSITGTYSKPLLYIDTDNSNIKIDILEIPHIKEEEEEEKSWNISEALEFKIDELTKKYGLLLKFLEEKLPDFQKEFSQYTISNT